MNAHFAEAHIERRKRLGMYTPQPVIQRPPMPKPTARDILCIEPTPANDDEAEDNIVITDEKVKLEYLRLANVPSWKRICVEVCYKHDVSLVQLVSPSRFREVVAARNEAMYRMRQEVGMSLTMIGRRVGGRDHTTALWGIEKHFERFVLNAYPKLPE